MTVPITHLRQRMIKEREALSLRLQVLQFGPQVDDTPRSFSPRRVRHCLLIRSCIFLWLNDIRLKI